jgi:hypothetical protein
MRLKRKSRMRVIATYSYDRVSENSFIVCLTILGPIPKLPIFRLRFFGEKGYECFRRVVVV